MNDYILEKIAEISPNLQILVLNPRNANYESLSPLC